MSELYNLFPTPPWVTTVILFFVVVLALYMGRRSAHGAIKEFFCLLHQSLRLGARSMALAEERLKIRNRDVLLSLGRDHAERELEREFFRVNQFVERDLGGYPQLQRLIEEQITRIDEDYHQSGTVPPPSPEWVQAVESIAKLHLKEKGNDLTQKILQDILQASEEQHQEVLEEHRQNVAERHALLKRMAPYWRKLSNSIDHLGKHLHELVVRAHNIDRQMEQFEEINKGSDKALRKLKASNTTQFGIALLFVLFAVGGAFFNFHLIALPMSEMVGAASRVGEVKVSDVAALVIIFLEITMGMFLLEGLQWTRLFPIIAAMDDKMRVRIAWVCGTILLVLAGVESGLAFMRDQIASDYAALRASLHGGTVAETMVNEWIPRVTSMFLGFTVPLALTLVAIPLEYLLHTGRNVIGMLIEYLLRLLAISMRVVGNACRHIGGIMINLYDMLIVLPLWIETLLQQRNAKHRESNNVDSGSALTTDSIGGAQEFYPREVSKNA